MAVMSLKLPAPRAKLYEDVARSMNIIIGLGLASTSS